MKRAGTGKKVLAGVMSMAMLLTSVLPNASLLAYAGENGWSEQTEEILLEETGGDTFLGEDALSEETADALLFEEADLIEDDGADAALLPAGDGADASLLPEGDGADTALFAEQEEDLLLSEPEEDLLIVEPGDEEPAAEETVPRLGDGEDSETGNEPVAASATPGTAIPEDPESPVEEPATDEPEEPETPSQEPATDTPEPEKTAGMTVLVPDQTYDVNIDEPGTDAWFTFTPETAGWYRFESIGNYDTIGALYTDPEGEALLENDDKANSSYSASDEGDYANFAVEYALEEGTTYYYRARMCYEDMAGSFEVKLTYVRVAIEEFEIVSQPRTTYYAGYDTTGEIDYAGLLVRVKYSNGSEEYLGYRAGKGYYYYNTDSHYSSVTESYLRISHNAASSYRNGYSYLTEGTFAYTVTYLDRTVTIPAQVVPGEQLPALSGDSDVFEGTVSSGQFIKFTAAATDYYVLHTEADLYSPVQAETYDTDRQYVSSVYGQSWYGEG